MSQKPKTPQITGSIESMRPRRVKFDGYFPGTPPAHYRWHLQDRSRLRKETRFIDRCSHLARDGGNECTRSPSRHITGTGMARQREYRDDATFRSPQESLAAVFGRCITLRRKARTAFDPSVDTQKHEDDRQAKNPKVVRVARAVPHFRMNPSALSRQDRLKIAGPIPHRVTL
jgi:hypothetical protein